MKVAAIICEYNPFHNGHAYQIKEVRQRLGNDTAIIGIMSGNYTQRGDVAIIHKYERAKMALLSGVDLVLEMPFPFCASSAENYARCGVEIADKFGCVDYLCFGCEDDDLDALSSIAENISSEEFESALSAKLNEKSASSLGHASITEHVYSKLFGNDSAHILKKPNNILAIEYIRALKAIGSKISPMPILRKGVEHDSNNFKREYASASLIRERIRTNEDINTFLPSASDHVLSDSIRDNIAPADINKLSNAILAFLRITPPDALDMIYECGGGLGRRLHACAFKAQNMQELTMLASTKKYTNARIRRAILFAMLGITSSDVMQSAPYTQVLALNTVGQALLANVKKTSRIPILTKPGDYDKLPAYAYEAAKRSFRADSIYSLTLPDGAPLIDFVKMSPFRKSPDFCLNLNE